MGDAFTDSLLPSLALIVSASGVVVTAIAARLPAMKARTGDLTLLMFALSAAAAVSATGAEPAWIVERRLVFDPFANFFHVALSLGAVAVAWLSLRHREGDAPQLWSWTALAASLLGLQVLASASAVVTAWAGLELAGLSAAAWIGAHRGARQAAASALLRGVLASALLLLGFGLLLGLSGAADYAMLASRLALVPSMPGGHAAMFTGVMLVTAAFGSRVAFAPWFAWPAADAAVLPLPVTLWVVVGGAMGGLAALGRFLGSAVCTTAEGGAWMSVGGLEWATVLGAAGVVTMLVANVAILREANLRRLIAWMAVSQAGYLALGPAGAARSGLEAALLQAVVSALTLTGLVAALEAVPAAAGEGAVAIAAGNGSDTTDATLEIRGLLRRPGRGRLPGLAVVVFLLSWAGMWPLAGRVGRYSMLSSAAGAGQWARVTVVVVAGILGWMGVVRLVAIMLDRGGQACAAGPAEFAVADGDALLLAGLLLAAVVALGVDPSGLAGFASWSVAFFAG